MNNVPLFVGLDYHQDSVQVCVLDEHGQLRVNKSCVNDWQQIRHVAEAHGTVKRAAIEACCGAAELAWELVEKAGWSLDLAHAGYVARMKQGPDKSDFSDGRLLADLTRVGYLPKVWLAPEYIRQLRQLVRYRQQVVEQQRNTKLRIGALLREHRLKGPGSRWSKPWMLWLREQALLETRHSRWVLQRHLEQLAWAGGEIRQVEERLREATAEDAVVQRLLQVKGIGYVTAWVMRAEIGRFDRFANGKQLSRFCGLSPANASSGLRQADAGLVWAGNPLLKSVLIEAGHRLMRQEDRWKQLAAKLKEAGKPTVVVAAAVANRWVRWLYYQLREVN